MDERQKPRTKTKTRTGILMLIGGAERRKGRETVLRRLVRRTVRRVIIIPTASQYPAELGAAYRRAFESLGDVRAEVLDIRHRDEADTPRFLDAVEAADVVFFTGGDQVRLVDILDGSELIRSIHRRHRSGMAIAGTSAGAAAASDPMIFDGDHRGLLKGSVGQGPGFGFLSDVTVDTHFLQRERLTRLTQFLLRGPSSKGIGLDEDTAIIVDHRGHFEVVGRGTVTVLNARGLTYNNYQRLETAQPISVNNLRLGFLSQGMRFSLNQWRVIQSADRQHLAS